MSAKFRIGALHDLYTQPLYRTLKSSPNTLGELLFDTTSHHIDRLLSKECDAVYVAPINYARNSSDLVIFPQVGVSGNGLDNTIRVYLRGDLRSITSLAVGNVTATDVVLARIVLAEKYSSTPVIIPVAGSVDAMLAKADCALVAGDALHTIKTEQPFIDIVDEWTDITELPFVHTLCVTRGESFNKELSELLISSQQAGRIEIKTIANELAQERNLSADDVYQFLSHFSYKFDEQERESLDAFFQMAFFHGLMGDVPEIKMGL